eukprot:s489_g8.t1
MAGHGYLAAGLLSLLPGVMLAAYVGTSKVFRKGMSPSEAWLCWSAMLASISMPLTCGFVGRHKRRSSLLAESNCIFGTQNALKRAQRSEKQTAAVGRSRMAETDEKQRLKAEIRKLEEALAKLDGENRRLLERNDELQLAYDEADRDAREAEAMNGHLLRRVEEMEVQIAALRQYEAEFDKRVTSMLDERDEALAAATRDKEAILLKVKELQEELALARRSVPGEAADAAELALMLKERQLEIEDLLDRNEELEHDLAKAREELQRAPRQAPTSAGTQPSGGLDQTSQDQYEELMGRVEHLGQERLRHFKADALEKDQRVLDAEKKLEQLARSLGAEGVVAENRELSRQNAEMKRQVGEAKRDLANYLSEAANIVYENDLLRSIANVKPEQLKLKDFKLKDKVTSAKAVAAAKQMEKEVAELEAERGKLKARLRQLSELAAEKVSLLHNLQPEQMLQLEEIAARMRKGKLELPLDDQSRQLKEERDELSKRLAAKDREVAEHVDRKVEEVLKKQGATKDLEAKVAALEKDNDMLQSSLEAYKAGYAELVMQQGPQALEQLVGRPRAPSERCWTAHARQLNRSKACRNSQEELKSGRPESPLASPHARRGLVSAGAMARSLRPLPPGVTPPPPGPPGPPAGKGLGAPAVLPKMPGMQPMVWSSLLQAVLQLPGELSDGSQETVCSLYCQVVEALEELSRERSLREGLAEEVSSFQQRFDRLLAEQEVLYKDYFAQREEWLATTRSLEERLRLQGDLLTDCQQKCDIQEGQMRTWQRLTEGTAPELQEELVSAMGRIAALEQNESVISRKVEAERQGHSIVKDAFDNLQKDCCEREGFLKERLSKAVLWKRRGANALRIARRRIQSMVATSDYERVQQQLQVCRQREFDLSRRQTELTLKVAQQEDKLREMMDLQDRCRSLDHLVRETEQEFAVLRRRLQLREPRFAAEVALFTRLTAELQRTLGFVGSFEAAARALGLAEARVAGLGFETGAGINVEASLDEKLRKFDVNNDGFISLGDLRKFFESLSIKEDELQLLAEALHGAQSQVTAPRPPPSAPGTLSPPAPPEPTAADKVNVSVLGVVGRFRLYGLRSLEPEELRGPTESQTVQCEEGSLRQDANLALIFAELFWASFQALLFRLPDQPDAQQVLRNSFMRLRNAQAMPWSGCSLDNNLLVVGGGSGGGSVSRFSASDSKERRSSTLDLLFPMYVVPLDRALEMSEVRSHEELLAESLLIQFDESKGRVIFVSHEWSGTQHADPEGEQLAVLQNALRHMLRERDRVPIDVTTEILFGQQQGLKTSEMHDQPLFIWFDYWCVPQLQLSVAGLQVETAQQKALDSIPAYVEKSCYFFILCPNVRHQNSGQLLSKRTGPNPT